MRAPPLTLHWADFEAFIDSSEIDTLASASESGLPFVNDLAVDDAFVYRTAARIVTASDDRLFLLLYPQSLHWPFQIDSELGVKGDPQHRRGAAARIAEKGFALLFGALRKSGRLDDALIMVSGDHGEFDYVDTLRVPRMRLGNFAEGVLSPIFFAKAPGGKADIRFPALAGNADRLVANTDIAPSIADILHARPSAGIAYSGHSLFAPVPRDRVVFSASTNAWRAWPKGAVAVSQDRARLLCDQRALCRRAIAKEPDLRWLGPASAADPLFRLALRDPAMRRALGKLYRNYY